jgi:methyl-accepting chemotaxis protein
MITRQRIGRAIMVAAVVAAVTCVIGAAVSWVFLGDLRDRSAASLGLAERTLENVDETLAIAEDVTATVGGSIDTLRATLDSVAGTVGDADAALSAVADITEDVPPALDRVDEALARLGDAGAVVDGAVSALDALPIGPDVADGPGLSAAVEGVREDLRPIADDLRNSTTTIRDLSGRSDELVAELDALQGDLDELDRSLEESTELLQRYRADTEEAVGLARDSLGDLDREVLVLRVLGVVLALAIAVGQIAPFHIGRQLAKPSITDDAPVTIAE